MNDATPQVLFKNRKPDRIATFEEYRAGGGYEALIESVARRTPAEILGFDARAALDRQGLPSALTRQRANGLNSMVGRIREAALAVQ